MTVSLIARIAAILAVVAALLGVGAYGAARHYAPIVAGLNQKVGEDAQALADQKAAYAVLAKNADTQNAAILGLQKAGEARAAAAESAASSARAESTKYQSKAAALLAGRPASGVDACAAASALVDEQIKEERSK